MPNTLKCGSRLLLRRAAEADIDFICALQEEADNRDYIVPFSRDDHATIIAQAKAALDIIVEERRACRLPPRRRTASPFQRAGVDAHHHRKEGLRLWA